MRRIFTFFLTFLLGVFVTALYAQTHTVSGTVIDKDANEPLIGANVLIKGTTIGTVTDLDGKYTHCRYYDFTQCFCIRCHFYVDYCTSVYRFLYGFHT